MDIRSWFAAAALAATACATAPVAPEKVEVFRDNRPTLRWAHQPGRTYHVRCTTVPRGDEQPLVIVDQNNYTEGQWTFQNPLRFNDDYRCEVRDQAEALVYAGKFTIQFEQAQAIAPADKQTVANLEPRFQWKPAQYPYVRYRLALAGDPQFAKSQEYPIGADALRTAPGEDGDSEIKLVEWKTTRTLEPGKVYYWRVFTYYYMQADLENGKRAKPEGAFGRVQSPTYSFTIPAQTSINESLVGVTRITDRKLDADPREPSVSKNYSVAYTLVEYMNTKSGELSDREKEEDGRGMPPLYLRKEQALTSIHVVNGHPRNGSPVFDRGDEQFTQSVRGSLDYAPFWDAASDGLYFTSNRALIPAIWHKGRAGRGYELLSNHDRPAMHATVSSDGKTIVYQLARKKPEEMERLKPTEIERHKNELFAIWKMDDDGRAPTDLGAGFDPAISNDGKRIAFVRQDRYGCEQIAIMDLEAGGGVMFLTNDGRNYHPRWSPDDQRLVFVSERDLPGSNCLQAEGRTNPNPDIWIMQADGTRPTRVTDYIGPDVDPTFTPDGNHIVFASKRDNDGAYTLWMGRLSSRGGAKLPDQPAPAVAPQARVDAAPAPAPAPAAPAQAPALATAAPAAAPAEVAAPAAAAPLNAAAPAAPVDAKLAPATAPADAARLVPAAAPQGAPAKTTR